MKKTFLENINILNNISFETLNQNKEKIKNISSKLNKNILVIGIGSSKNAALVAKNNLIKSNIKAFDVIEPLSFYENKNYYQTNYNSFILISQSGKTNSLFDIYEDIKNKYVLFMTNDTDYVKNKTQLDDGNILKMIICEEIVDYRSLGFLATTINLIELFNPIIDLSIEKSINKLSKDLLSKKVKDFNFKDDTVIWLIANNDTSLFEEIGLKFMEMCGIKSITTSLETFSHGMELSIGKNDIFILEDINPNPKSSFIDNDKFKKILKDIGLLNKVMIVPINNNYLKNIICQSIILYNLSGKINELFKLDSQNMMSILFTKNVKNLS